MPDDGDYKYRVGGPKAGDTKVATDVCLQSKTTGKFLYPYKDDPSMYAVKHDECGGDTWGVRWNVEENGIGFKTHGEWLTATKGGDPVKPSGKKWPDAHDWNWWGTEPVAGSPGCYHLSNASEDNKYLSEKDGKLTISA
jgi:hypothetical protein